MADLENLKLGDWIDISIPLHFNGPQPNAYGVDKAMSEPVCAGDLIGDTREGGSVNFEQYTFIPHCNGTHTECVGHITNERISVADCLRDVIIQAVVLSVKPETTTNDSYSVPFGESDSMITRGSLAGLKSSIGSGRTRTALIVRTNPNEESKLSCNYSEDRIPPYFTIEAMRLIVELGFDHLLVDVPSVDRLFDDGNLSNHRIFWNVEPKSFELRSNLRRHCTITEMIYVPNYVEDGEYLLNLQIAPFDSDAAPSRPMILRR